MKPNTDLRLLEASLHYTFTHRDRLQQALQHRSYVNESRDPALGDNERLEFLGDAVLNLVVSDLLMQFHPELREGDLSRCRAGLVNEAGLAAVARKLHLGQFLRLGRGEEQTLGREKDSILANTFEALVAAVYLDGGFAAAQDVIGVFFRESIRSTPVPAASPDYKSTLQELVQQQYGTVPVYEIVGETGPDHDKTFSVQIRLSEMTVAGSGKSKKNAEQEAARNLLEKLLKQQRNPPL